MAALGIGGQASSVPAITPAFVPIVDAASIPAPPTSPLLTARTPEIEIDTGGTKIRLAGGVDTKALTAVLRAVRAADS